MNTKPLILWSLLMLVFIAGCTLFNGAKENKTNAVTQESLSNELIESRARVGIVTSDFYNGKYQGKLPIEDAVKIIEEEIEVQKIIYQKYNELPNENKTDKRIYMQFFQLGKYGWAPESSMLRAIKESSF